MRLERYIHSIVILFVQVECRPTCTRNKVIKDSIIILRHSCLKKFSSIETISDLSTLNSKGRVLR